MSSVAQRLGARLREIRVARHLSQEQLAERSGVSYKFIGDVERGKGNPTLNWLEAVARGLGVSLRDLIVDEEPTIMQYPPLSGRDYSIVRDARDTLEDILQRYGTPTRSKKRKSRQPR